MCDAYVYEDVMGGWTTHIAGNKPIIPPIPQLQISWMPRLHGEWDIETRTMRYANRWRAAFAYVICSIWALSHRLHYWSLDLIPRREIGLPHDGERFNDPTPEACSERLKSLRLMGYRIPQYAIDALLSEKE
jgi:hypothetical protein